MAENRETMKLPFALLLLGGLVGSACSTGTPSSRYYEKAQAANRDARKLTTLQKELCEKGSAVDCTNYARSLLAEGQKDEAVAAFDLACSKGQAIACAERAVFDFDAGNYGEAEDALNEACEKTQARFCVYAGQIAAQKGNPVRALNYFKKSCQAGDMASCVLHGRGLRIQNQFGLATPSLRKACDEGFTPSCTDLGIIHWGEGKQEKAIEDFDRDCERRYDRACRFANILRLKRANPSFDKTQEAECKNGSKDACHAAALLQFLRKGGRPLAMHRWRENCKAGHALSCWDDAIENTGILPTATLFEDARVSCDADVGAACALQAHLTRATGDRKTAYSLWAKACELGDSSGCQQAAQDSSLSDETRLRYLSLACDQGLKAACREAGTDLYWSGRTEEAKKYLDIACPTRTALACIEITSQVAESNRLEKLSPDDLAERCNTGEAAVCTIQGHALFKAKRVDEAMATFRKGCDHGDGDACAFLAERGRKDGALDLARTLFRKACDLKSTLGCEGFLSLYEVSP